MSGVIVRINNVPSNITVTDITFNYIQDKVESKIEYQDIIGIDIPKDEENEETISRNLYYIRPTQKENKLEKKKLHITASKNEMLQLCSDVNEKIHKVVEGRPKSVVVFLNPIGGSANSLPIYKKYVEPIFRLAGIKCELVVSEKADHFKELAQSYDFSPYDALVIIGGDGTLNELINGILQRKQKEFGVDLNDQTAVLKPIDIPLAIIPTGTGNGMVKVAQGCVDPITSTLHIIKGKTKCYAVFGNFCRNSLVAYSVMMTAYGMFGDLIHYTDTNRWLRRARYIFVPLWFFSFKTLRTFDAEVTYEYWKDEKENEDIPNAVETASGTMTGTEKATLSCLLALPFRDGIFNGNPFGESNHPGEDFIVIVYRPTSRFAIIKHFFSLKGELHKEDFEIPGFVSLRNIKSMKVEVPNSETNLDLMVNLDGELFKLTHPEIYIKLNSNAYRMFTSFDHK